MVIELADDGYKLVGSTGDASRDDRRKVIGDILADGDLRTANEVHTQWTEDIPKPSKRTIQQDLNHGYDLGWWQREGKGVRGDQYRYRFDSRTVPPLSARIESNSPAGGPGSGLSENFDNLLPKHSGSATGEAPYPNE